MKQPGSVPQRAPTNEDKHDELERLRARFEKEVPSYESLTASDKKALLTMTEYGELPQPVNYGLTYEETFHGLYISPGRYRDETPDSGFSTFRYKQGEWVNFWSARALAVFLPLYFLGFVIFAASNPQLPGGWILDNPRALAVFFLGMVFPGCFLFGIICAVVQAREESYKTRHPSGGLLAFRRALCVHKLYIAAAREAEQTKLELLKRKRSYWEFLDGYAFERATAEVLKRHQFNPRLTPGSADGGIDIEVTRNGLKGVVQCKAHVASVGPHVVRDLYAVINHCRADFGIIVSRGGFTRGAIDFARDKPILFLDVSDLIAMQEDRDVLAAAFTRKET